MPRGDQIDEDRYFIEPDVSLPNGEHRPALTYLTERLVAGKDAQPGVCADILVAPAGLGKTTLARATARQILRAKRETIPILVESAHWQNLINLTLPNILNAALLHLIPDAVRLTNRKLFRLLVREQLLVPIFDGFDELCLHPLSNYNPTILINELLDLVGDADATVLVTTRQTFWEKIGEGETFSNRVRRINLQGFSNDQRKKFFAKRLKLPQERDLAQRLTREIGERMYENATERPGLQGERASGVPLMLELVAMYVQGNADATFAPLSGDPLGPLLEAVCERENVRQKLEISAGRQMMIFEELFRDHHEDIPRSDLGLYVEFFAPKVTGDAIVRFESHAFFSPGADVKARFESLKVYFVARWLANRLADLKDTELVIAHLEKNATGNTDVFDFLLERLRSMEEAKVQAAISHALMMVQARPKWEGAASALFHLAHRIAASKGKDAATRTALLIKTLGVKSPIAQVAVQGQIGSLDFTGLQFKNSTFKDVAFHNCTFDENTSFIGCRFEGSLSFERCKNAGLARLDGCRFSDEAQEAFDIQAGKTAKRVITNAVAKEALREILRKFIGPFGYSTIKESDKNSGPVLRNPCRESAWEELFRANILERHRISGVRSGGINVSNNPEVKHEVRNFLDNAVLGGQLQKVIDEIVRRG
jgi:hypothetical protein